MDLSKAIKLIEYVEGLRLEAYLCTAGKWTIGIGHTKGVKKGDRISHQEARRLLNEDLDWATNVIDKYVTTDLNSDQYNALVSFVFRLGGPNFKESTLLKVLNSGKEETIKVSSIRQGFGLFLEQDGHKEIDLIHYNFIRWCWSSKRREWLKSLYKRHSLEYALFSSGVVPSVS